MQPIRTALMALLIAISISAGCEKGTTPKDQSEDTLVYYTNPVFEPTFADPTLVKADDGYFYAYATEDFWEGGEHLIAIIRSPDLVNWKFVADAFTVKPDWKQGGLWAPNVFRYDNKYCMFYSLSVWGDSNPGIGFATSEQPQGPFNDMGKFFLSSEVGVTNSIDPFFFRDPVTHNLFIFWGSFHGIFGQQLLYSNGAFSLTGEKFQVAGNSFEGTYLLYKDGYYYFFGSCGSCCDGINSTYHVRVGRSADIKGPYLDPLSQQLLSDTGDPGKLLIKANGNTNGFAGPGHNAEIILDDAGDYWFVYHAIDKELPYLNNGATRRPLLIDRLTWYENWPVIEYAEPSIIRHIVPAFRSEGSK
ncbi:MAG: family 43 glycosylhydrolase [Bacteroidales bacterium]|nr:family 43 glycosylhydrolase [Bacteroidales bacterium]